MAPSTTAYIFCIVVSKPLSVSFEVTEGTTDTPESPELIQRSPVSQEVVTGGRLPVVCYHPYRHFKALAHESSGVRV